MKTNDEEWEEAKPISRAEAIKLGLPVEKSPDEILDEMEEELEAYRDSQPGNDDEEEDWDNFKPSKDFDFEADLTHQKIDGIPGLSDLDAEDPCPGYDEDEDGNIPPEQDKIFTEWCLRYSERRHRIFIDEMVSHGNRRIAYQTAYPGVKNSTARVNACKLLANPGIARQVQEGLAAKKQQEEELLKKIYDGRLTALEEKRAVLARVIRGEAENGGPKDKPAYLRDILHAIVIDNKMEAEWKNALALPNRHDAFFND